MTAKKTTTETVPQVANSTENPKAVHRIVTADEESAGSSVAQRGQEVFSATKASTQVSLGVGGPPTTCRTICADRGRSQIWAVAHQIR
jgi:hypothetical protein